MSHLHRQHTEIVVGIGVARLGSQDGAVGGFSLGQLSRLVGGDGLLQRGFDGYGGAALCGWGLGIGDWGLGRALSWRSHLR